MSRYETVHEEDPHHHDDHEDDQEDLDIDLNIDVDDAMRTMMLKSATTTTAATSSVTAESTPAFSTTTTPVRNTNSRSNSEILAAGTPTDTINDYYLVHAQNQHLRNEENENENEKDDVNIMRTEEQDHDTMNIVNYGNDRAAPTAAATFNNGAIIMADVSLSIMADAAATDPATTGADHNAAAAAAAAAGFSVLAANSASGRDAKVSIYGETDIDELSSQLTTMMFDLWGTKPDDGNIRGADFGWRVGKAREQRRDNMQSFQTVTKLVDQNMGQGLYNLERTKREAIIDELHGIQSRAIPETAESIATALQQMEQTLQHFQQHGAATTVTAAGIPITTELLAAYVRASTILQSAYVTSSELRLAFLRHELYHIEKATIRYLRFLTMMYDLFGDIALLRPLYLSDLTHKEMLGLKRGNEQLLNARDHRLGRRIYVQLNLMRPDRTLTFRERLRTQVYWRYTVLLEDETAQRNGAVNIIFLQRNDARSVAVRCPTLSSSEEEEEPAVAPSAPIIPRPYEDHQSPMVEEMLDRYESLANNPKPVSISSARAEEATDLVRMSRFSRSVMEDMVDQRDALTDNPKPESISSARAEEATDLEEEAEALVRFHWGLERPGIVSSRRTTAAATYSDIENPDEYGDIKKPFNGIFGMYVDQEARMPPREHKLQEIEWITKITEASPIRYIGQHYCMPDEKIFHFFKAIMLSMQPSALNACTRVHAGSYQECNYAMCPFGIPVADIPTTASGNIKNKGAWAKLIKVRKAMDAYHQKRSRCLNVPYVTRQMEATLTSSDMTKLTDQKIPFSCPGLDCPDADCFIFGDKSQAKRRVNKDFKEYLKMKLQHHDEQQQQPTATQFKTDSSLEPAWRSTNTNLDSEFLFGIINEVSTVGMGRCVESPKVRFARYNKTIGWYEPLHPVHNREEIRKLISQFMRDERKRNAIEAKAAAKRVAKISRPQPRVTTPKKAPIKRTFGNTNNGNLTPVNPFSFDDSHNSNNINNNSSIFSVSNVMSADAANKRSKTNDCFCRNDNNAYNNNAYNVQNNNDINSNTNSINFGGFSPFTDLISSNRTNNTSNFPGTHENSNSNYNNNNSNNNNNNSSNFGCWNIGRFM